MIEKLYACEPQFLLTYISKMENATAEEIALAAGQFAQPVPREDIYDEDGEEACIKVEGPLTQAGPPPLAHFFGFGGTSYSAILKAVAYAKDNPAIKRLCLEVNSPGGEVSGVDHVWQALRACGKNCSAVNMGLMASAAYWIASACEKISATSPAAETGSIGVIAVGIDDADLMKNLGVKKVTILSKNAPDKGLDFATDKGRASIQKRANEIESVFISRVAEGRHTTAEAVKENFGKGALKIAMHQPGETCACALHSGMIDAVTPMAPNTDSRKTPGAQYAQSGRNEMKLSELLAANPEAKTEHEKALADARAEGKAAFEARVTAAKPYLALKATADGYDTAEVEAIAKCAVDVITGAKDAGAVQAFVAFVDMSVEKRKLAAAHTETATLPETPGQHTPAMADLIVKVNAQKLDLAAIETASKRQGIEPIKGVAATVEMNDLLAKDKQLLSTLGGM